jgi:hypothetical protein
MREKTREAGRATKRVFPGANCGLMYFLNPTPPGGAGRVHRGGGVVEALAMTRTLAVYDPDA